MHYSIETSCRACTGEVETVMNYGEVPLADRLFELECNNDEEWPAPLTLARCRKCGLIQILETVEPRILFYSDYPYFSSVSPALLPYCNY